MKAENLQYRDGEVTLHGYAAYDESRSGKRPGILVMPEAFGLGPHAKQRGTPRRIGLCGAGR
jgi:dienelactone hydrolase